MVSTGFRWCTALIPGLVSLLVTSYLLVSQDWRQWGIQAVMPTEPSLSSFADLANITFTADCVTASQPLETCDPFGRPFQPYVVLPAQMLSFLGIGSSFTNVLGALLAVATVGLVAGLAALVSARWQRERAGLVVVQVALTLASISPAVILGIERGQIEIIVTILTVLSLLLLVRDGTTRWWGVITSIASVMVKYVTLGMFLAFANRETWKRRNVAVAASVVASSAYLFLSFRDLQQATQASRSLVPQTTASAFGLTNTIATPLSGSELTWLPPDNVSDHWVALRLIGIILFVGVVGLLAFLLREMPLPRLTSISWTLTVGSGGVLLLPYLLGSSHDYRLIFLLPLIAGAGLWWGESSTSLSRYLSSSMVLFSTLALITSASMVPTPQGWRWPTLLIVVGDFGLFMILALIAALVLLAALHEPVEKNRAVFTQ